MVGRAYMGMNNGRQGIYHSQNKNGNGKTHHESVKASSEGPRALYEP
jgi:hypothetical protein